MNEVLQVLKKKIGIMENIIISMDDTTLNKTASLEKEDEFGLFNKMAKCEIAKRNKIIEDWKVDVKNTGFIISFKSDMDQGEAAKVIFG